MRETNPAAPYGGTPLNFMRMPSTLVTVSYPLLPSLAGDHVAILVFTEQ